MSKIENFYSHPNVELKWHLESVQSLMVEKWESFKVKPKMLELINEEMAMVIQVIGMTHDFGKYTDFFQNYLNKEKGKLQEPKHHALLSALLFSLFYSKIQGKLEKSINEKIKPEDYLRFNENEKDWQHFPSFLRMIGFEIVLRHHGNLKDMYWETNHERDDFTITWDDIKDQVNSIINNKEKIIEEYTDLIRRNINHSIIDKEEICKQFIEALNMLEKKYSTRDAKRIFRDHLEEIRRIYYNLYKRTKQTSLKMLVFNLTQTLFSLLIYSDKKIAANIGNQSNETRQIDENIVERYKESKFGNDKREEMDKLRESFYEKALNKLEEIDITKQRIFTETAPTGIGKTLTVLSQCLKIRQRIQNELKYAPKIIYCLPFTSIIDQNHTVFEEVLRGINDFEENESNYLIKHHHLSDFKYIENNEERPNNEAMLLIEAWESEIIVTTFVQLFLTMLGFQNKSLKKFTQLFGSIIILDEVQAIPPEYWILFKEYAVFLSENYGTYFILLTATQPAIFDVKETQLENQTQNAQINQNMLNNDGLNNFAVELGSPEVFFKEFDRIELEYNPDVKTFGEICDIIKANIIPGKDNSRKTIITILNTIKSSKTMFNEIEQAISNDEKMKNNGVRLIRYSELDGDISKIDDKTIVLIYLSTNIIPKHRKERIDLIKELIKKGKRFILVCTQLIEAGVDIDAELIIRDMAPLDSIIQSAGRCNRNSRMNKQKGKVIVTDISYPEKYSQYIYSVVLLQKTQNILDKYSNQSSITIQESMFRSMAEEYYKHVKETKEYTEQYIGIMQKLMFDYRPGLQKPRTIEYLSQIKLIKDDFKEDVFIIIDKEASDLMKQMIETKNEMIEGMNDTNKDLFFEQKRNSKEIRRKMGEYIVQIRVKKGQFSKNLKKNEGIELYSVDLTETDNQDAEKIYDSDLGLI